MTERPRNLSATQFPPHYRLHHKPEFDRIYRGGRRINDPNFQAVIANNTLSHPRLGLSISAKAAGNAVSRNRIKRFLRESFRHNAARLPGLDIIINARAPIKTATKAALIHSTTQLWDKLARHA